MEIEDLNRMNTIKELCLKGKYDDCIKAANDMIDEQPYNFIPILFKGISLLKQKRYDEAEDAFTLGIKLDPTIPRFWAERGNVFLNIKKYNEAFSDYWNYLQFHPNDGDALNNCALVLYYMGNDDLTFEYLERAIKIGDNCESYCMMIVMLKKIGFIGFIEKYYNEALNKFPEKKNYINEIMSAKLKNI